MANNVVVQVLGGSKQVLDGVNTLQDVMTKLNLSGYTGSINTSPAQASDRLEDGDFVALSQALKGGLI